MGTVVIQLYAGECTPSVDRALLVPLTLPNYNYERPIVIKIIV